MDLDHFGYGKEFPPITDIKRKGVCPRCGNRLMNDGGCLFCYCGFSLCG